MPEVGQWFKVSHIVFDDNHWISEKSLEVPAEAVFIGETIFMTPQSLRRIPMNCTVEYGPVTVYELVTRSGQHLFVKPEHCEPA